MTAAPAIVSSHRTGLLAAIAIVAIVAGCATGGNNARVAVRPLADTPREMTADQQIHQALNRLTFGATEDDYERVRREGLDRWIGEQLAPQSIDDAATDRFLERYPYVAQPETTLARIYGLPGDLRRAGGTNPDTAAIRAADRASAQVIGELREARVARATLSKRQLLEVMVDFWENHFSIYADKGADRYMLVDYDRTIREHALGKFSDLLAAVAHSPAMLYYLDNLDSKADSDRVTLAELQGARRAREAQQKYATARNEIFVDRAGKVSVGDPNLKPPAPYRPPVRRGRGLNENYGRELMELHTLGVDGGYTQQDVIEAARVLTGWTVRNPDHIGTFYFNPAMHDAGSKVVLGHVFPAGHGEDEGDSLLALISREPATARFISMELCRRFVTDSPSTALVDRAAAAFTRTDGDIAEVMRVIIGSPEFFSRAAYRAKVKSPFEVVVSTMRALDAEPDTLQRDVQAVARLGEPIFGHIAPDGYPETGDQWINTGSILNRINFGMLAAAGQVTGMSVKAWPRGRDLENMPRTAQADSLVAILLGGDASSDTRKILDEGANPAAASPATSARDFTALVGLALGAPEFQRR